MFWWEVRTENVGSVLRSITQNVAASEIDLRSGSMGRDVSASRSYGS